INALYGDRQDAAAARLHRARRPRVFDLNGGYAPLPLFRIPRVMVLTPAGIRGPTGASPLMVSSRRPSRLKATWITCPWCRINRVTGAPVAASQTQAVSSSLAVTTRLPSGLNAAQFTLSV